MLLYSEYCIRFYYLVLFLDVGKTSANKSIPIRIFGYRHYPLDREVVKLVTRGTLIEPLHNEANYLLSIATGSTSTVGLAWTDISTSEFQVRVVNK